MLAKDNFLMMGGTPIAPSLGYRPYGQAADRRDAWAAVDGKKRL